MDSVTVAAELLAPTLELVGLAPEAQVQLEPKLMLGMYCGERLRFRNEADELVLPVELRAVCTRDERLVHKAGFWVSRPSQLKAPPKMPVSPVAMLQRKRACELVATYPPNRDLVPLG